MKLYKLVSLFSLSVLTAACTPLVWVKQGATANQFNKEKYECLKSSQHQVIGTRAQWDGACNCMRQLPFSELQTNETMFNACMNAKGWSLQKQK